MNKRTHKRCGACGVLYEKGPRDPSFRKWCSIDCAITIAKRDTEKRKRKELRARKAKLLTKSDHTRLAQRAFNAYIRERDPDVCISCGATNPTGGWNAGHYRAIGSGKGKCNQLRFHVLNCWKQCVHCNRDLSGNQIEYRKSLVKKLGEERVQALENDNRIVKQDVEYLKRVTEIFNRRRRHLRALRRKHG